MYLYLSLVTLFFVRSRAKGSTFVWERGEFIKVSVQANFSYTATVNGESGGEIVLQEGSLGFHCDGHYHALHTHTVTAVGNLLQESGIDPQLGHYDQLSQYFRGVSNSTTNCAVNATIQYFKDLDIFIFRLHFHPKGLKGTSALPMPKHQKSGGTVWVNPLPLATEFPSFLVPNDLHFMQTSGNMLGSNFNVGTMGSFSGGLNGGPLVIYNATTPDAGPGYHLSSVVLSPLFHHKTIFTSQRPFSGKTPFISPNGKYIEKTHAKMNLIICTEQIQSNSLFFTNYDPRSTEFWTFANCSRTGTYTCSGGNFFKKDGTPFGTRNWDAVIAPDFSNITTSEGSTWIHEMYPRTSVGISGYIDTIPSGYEQAAVLVGRPGIAASYTSWGHVLQAAGGSIKLSLEDDEYNRVIHYMTDNGGYYCFCNVFNVCPDRRVPMHKIIAELKQYHLSLGLHIGLYHLDPFWHSHHSDGHCDGVTASNWSYSAYHWPKGLGVNGSNPNTRWQMLYMLLAGPNYQTDLPGGNVYEHEFWMESQDLDTSVGGSGSDCCGKTSQVVPSQSHAFWDKILGYGVSTNNLHALVVDTLPVWFTGFSSRINNTDSHELWLDGYLGPSHGIGSGGATKYKLPIRIDQSLPSDHMLSVARNWSAVVSARLMGDYQRGGSWTQFATTGLFLASLGIRPVVDVLWTTEKQPNNPNKIKIRLNIEHELIMAVLTTGPVGFGDMLNVTNATRLNLATRADGVILKPAFAAYRFDGFYYQPSKKVYKCAKKEIWLAVSVPARSQSARIDRRANSMVRLQPLNTKLLKKKANLVWWYNILMSNIGPSPPSEIACTLLPSCMWPTPMDNTQFVVASFTNRCVNGTPATNCVIPFSSDNPINASTIAINTGYAADWRLLSAAPVLPGGWVLLGEQNKYVQLSPQRFISSRPVINDAILNDAMNVNELMLPENDGISFIVIGMPGEMISVTVLIPNPFNVITELEAALAGVVTVVKVTIPTSGRSEIQCRTNGCIVLSN